MKNSLGNKEIMAQNIKYFLNLNNLNQTEFCKLLGLKMATLSDWLNAKTYPRIDKIELMANFFGVDKSVLVEKRSLQDRLDTTDLREVKLINHFRKLNDLGKNKAIDNIQDLTQIDKYTIHDKEIKKAKEKDEKQENVKKFNLKEELAKLDPIETIAAHNDYLDDPEEMDKIRQDLEEMDKWDW